GTSAGGTETASQLVSGGDGTTGAKEVDNGNYYVAEDLTNSGDYTTTLSCVDNGGSPFDPGAGAIPVSAGHQVVCTYTNTRKTGTLEVKKVLNPTSDTGTFDLTIDSTSFTNNGAGFGNNGTTGQITVDTGSHSASEAGHGTTSLTDYVSSYSCSNGVSGNGTSIAGITVNDGDHVLCTFTNARKPMLTIVKTVTNDNGGTALPTAWLLSATGAGNDPNSFSGQGGAGPRDVTAGVAYTLAESGGPSGYTAGSWSCNGGSLVGSAVTLATGQTATCTIVNNDNAPALHLIKTVTNDNGGTALATAWTLHADGAGNAPSNLAGPTPVASGAAFKADTYALDRKGGA